MKHYKKLTIEMEDGTITTIDKPYAVQYWCEEDIEYIFSCMDISDIDPEESDEKAEEILNYLLYNIDEEDLQEELESAREEDWEVIERQIDYLLSEYVNDEEETK